MTVVDMSIACGGAFFFSPLHIQEQKLFNGWVSVFDASKDNTGLYISLSLSCSSAPPSQMDCGALLPGKFDLTSIDTAAQ